MPGFVIHLAVANEYMLKHKDEIKNEKEFIRGIVEPDLISDLNKNISKGKTHYGKNGVRKIKSYLDLFLADPKVDMSKDYYKGYFVHLVTDNEFYLNYFKNETLEMISKNDSYYHDYDCLNKILMEKYKVSKIYDENVDKFMNYLDEEPKYLNKEKVVDFVDKVTDESIKERIEDVKEECLEEKIKKAN